MEARFWLILSMWLSVNVAYADQERKRLREELWEKLIDDSAIDPQDTYALLWNLSDYGESDRIVFELRLLELPKRPYCKRETPIQRLDNRNHPLLQVPKVAMYLNYLEKLEQEDCQFMSMSRQTRQALPDIDTFDCDRLLVKNRLEHGKRELYDISRAIAKDPSKCPRFKDSAEYFAINAKLFTCSGKDCCEVTETYMPLWDRGTLPYVPTDEFYEAQDICRSLIKNVGKSEIENFEKDIYELKDRLNWSSMENLERLLRWEIRSLRYMSERRGMLDVLQKKLKKPCENIMQNSLVRWQVVTDEWASRSSDKKWGIIHSCKSKMEMIDAMVEKLSCKKGGCF